MSKNLDATTAAILREAAMALLAVIGDDQPAKAAKAPKAAKAVKSQPADLVAAKSHCYEARMARRASTKLGGLTKAERSALWASNPQLHTMAATPRAKAWARLVAEYKANA